ncbi:MAG: hypothetical protein Q9191_001901 [Dirinaria sp. TL-2023a]
MEDRGRRRYERIDDDGSPDYDADDAAEHDHSPTPTSDPSKRKSPRTGTGQESHKIVSFDTGHEQAYDSRAQTRYLLNRQLFRWLGTAFFASFFAISLKIYAMKGVITPTQKATFNAIITALSLGLGLNFFEAFKDLAKLLRWRFLAAGHHSVREVDLILGIENLVTVCRLGWESLGNRKLWQFLFSLTWILLNLSAQVSVALVNLTYSLDDGTDWNGTYTREGTVNVANLSCYFHNQDCPSDDHEDIVQATAHAYGEVSSGTVCGPYNTTADILHSRNDYEYYCRRTPGNQQFAYRFSEYNPRDLQRTHPHFTNRIVTASAGQCFQYSQVNLTLAPDLNGLMNAWNYTFTNGSYTSSIRIPVNMEAVNGTAYVYRSAVIPQEAVTWSCGPRCMWLWAHKSFGAGEPSTFYQCPITVSQVSNVTHPGQNITDGIARLAASAIGLQGRFVGSPPNRTWTQYQFYPFGSQWEVHFKNADAVGANMAEFAIGSISTLVTRNPQIAMQGTVPYLGSRIRVLWGYAIPLLVSIAGVHLVLFATVVYASRVVVIRDDSNLSTARLLRTLIDHLGASGTLLDGNQLSRAITPSVADGVVYGPRHDEISQRYSLGMAKDVTPRKELPNSRHPDGIYL